MNRFRQAFAVLVLAALAAAEGSAASLQSPEPAERPRLASRVYRDALHDARFHPSPLTGLRYWNQGVAGYGVHRVFPEPGQTTLWLAAGSDDYLGTGLATSVFDPATNLTFRLEGSWERGETWWGDYDFDQFRIAPAVSWSNGKTTVWLAFEHTETTFEKERPVPRPRPSLQDRTLHRAATIRRDMGRFEEELTLNSVHTGVHHRVNRFLSLGLSFSFVDASGHSSFESLLKEP